MSMPAHPSSPNSYAHAVVNLRETRVPPYHAGICQRIREDG
jgi:hypothetical protein